MKHPIIINSNGKIEQIPKLGIIARYLTSTKGRNKLAQALINPIRNRMDYNSLGRKIFITEQLPVETMIKYNTSPLEKYNHRSIFIGSDGKIKITTSFPGIFRRRAILSGFKII